VKGAVEGNKYSGITTRTQSRHTKARCSQAPSPQAQPIKAPAPTHVCKVYAHLEYKGATAFGVDLFPVMQWLRNPCLVS
jgi:hypothetical protein